MLVLEVLAQLFLLRVLDCKDLFLPCFKSAFLFFLAFAPVFYPPKVATNPARA
jgi:hypothetical protein